MECVRRWKQYESLQNAEKEDTEQNRTNFFFNPFKLIRIGPHAGLMLKLVDTIFCQIDD